MPRRRYADTHRTGSHNATWQDRAKCRDADPVTFEVSPMEVSRPNREYVRRTREVMRDYCWQCPVFAQCLRLGREGKSDGIWGGHVLLDGVVRDPW